MSYQNPDSLFGEVRCNFLDDIASAFPEAPIAFGFSPARRAIAVRELLDAKGFAGLPFLPFSKTIGKRSKRCFVSGGLRLLVLWSAGDIETAK